MSYANGTLNYNLPQTVGTDKRDWSDTNQAFSDVDAALKAASDASSQAAEDITALTTRVGTAEDDIVALKGEDISLDGRLDTAEGAISSLQTDLPDVRRDLEDMITAYNEASATSTHAYAIGDYFIYNDVLYKATSAIAVGATIVPNTNCTATNVSTQLNQINNDLSNISTRIDAHSFGSEVDLTNYTSTSNMYTCPSDGYFIGGLKVGAYQGSVFQGMINDGTNQIHFDVANVLSSASTLAELQTVFVKKGMKLWYYTTDAGHNQAVFRPLS